MAILRKLLVVGATSVIQAGTHRRSGCSALDPIAVRAPAHARVTVAMANTIAWAMLARGDIYRPPAVA